MVNFCQGKISPFNDALFRIQPIIFKTSKIDNFLENNRNKTHVTNISLVGPIRPILFLASSQAGHLLASVPVLYLHKTFKLLRPGRVPQLFQRLCLYLPDSFPRYIENLADLFKRMIVFFTKTKTHPHYPLFPRR